MGKWLSALILVAAFMLPVNSFGAEKFGIIFDIKGNATIKGADGKVISLDRAKHVLKPVFSGDVIEVKGEGKVLVVSVNDKKGYELSANTMGVIGASDISTKKGKINVREGYQPPAKAASGPIGATVMRSTIKKPCVKILSPVNTSINNLSPTLEWETACKDAEGVLIRVLAEREIIFEGKADGHAIKLPDGLLQNDKTYRWLVDAGPAMGIIGGTFSTISREAADQLDQKQRNYSANRGDLGERLSYVFFLLEKNLRSLAQTELALLKKDFPDSQYIKELE